MVRRRGATAARAGAASPRPTVASGCVERLKDPSAVPNPGAPARGIARDLARHRLRHDEVRTPFRLVVHAAEVLADQPEEQELHAGEEGDRDDERSEALR